MTLDATQRARLLNTHVRECRVRLWVFDPLTTPSVDGYYPGASLASITDPMALISPPYSILRPGENVTLYGGDSFERGDTPATGHTWALESGSAILQPSGNTCVVTPTIPDSVVKVSLTVTATNSQTSTRYAYIVTSAEGWTPPAGTISAQGDYSAGGWSGRMALVGDAASAAQLVQDALVLIHIETYYDGQAVTMGGYKRPNNLALLRIVDWSYNESANDGRGETVIELESPDEALERVRYWQAPTVYDGHERGLAFVHAASTSQDELYWSDFRITDAILFIVGETNMVENFNFTVFDDSNEFAASGQYWLPIDTVRNQIKSTVESAAGVYFCNFAGSIQCIPSPSVRADEWWGTPDPIFAAANPLTQDYVLDYRIEYNREHYDGVILRGFDDSLQDVTIRYPSAINADTGRWLEIPGAYIKPQQQWAEDMLAFANRDWDVICKFAGLGNVLNVGDFTYINFEPRQAGHDSATGLAYITAIQHEIDLDTHMQVSTVHLVQVTNWD